MEPPEAPQPRIEAAALASAISITSPLAAVTLDPSNDTPSTHTTTTMPPSSTAANPVDTTATAAAPSATTDIVLGPSNDALRADILRQVEFYFSDANIVTDDFLLKQISRGGPEGWVPIKTIASFAKIKKLTRNIATVVAALRTSLQLQVSPEGARVRRMAPLPNVDLDEVRRRSVIAWNLPGEKPTIESVIELFSKAGTVAMARIRKPDHPEPLLARGLAAEVAKGAREYYALVEYVSEAEAVTAVANLNDDSNWRSGLKVRALLPLMPAAGAPTKAAKKVAHASAQVEKAAGPAEEKMVAAAAAVGVPAVAAAPAAPAEERPRPAWATGKKKNKAEYAAWASASTAAAFDRAAAGEGDAAAAVSDGKPRMPDGGRGFGMGRGKPPPGAWTPPPAAPGSTAAAAEEGKGAAAE